MKKNLIGIVAAGLALALAFTGCESGSDSPVKYATDLDNPVTKGSKFTYKVSPTEYTYKDPATVGITTPDDSGSYKSSGANGKGWTVTRYVNGVQSYNRKFANTTPYKDVDKSKPVVGDVLNTKSATIVLNSKDNTFEWTEDSSSYEVKEIKELITATHDDDDSYVMLPYEFETDATETFAVDTGADTKVDNDYLTKGKVKSNPTSGTKWDKVDAVFGQATIDAAADVKAKQTAWDTQYAGLSYADKKAFDEAADDAAGKETLQPKYAAVKKAKKAQGNLAAYIEASNIYKQGARYIITDTVTKSGATTGDASYYKDITKSLAKTDSNTNFVQKVSKAGGTAKAKATGTYKITSGNYSTGTFLVTSITEGDTATVFNDDGTYTLKGVLQINPADTDFPVSTASTVASPKKGNRLNSAHRVFTISNGVLTTPRFETGYTDDTVRSKNGFFGGSSYTTYANAKVDADKVAAGTAATCEAASPYAYNLVK